MSTTVTYKGNTIATLSNETKSLATAGTWVEGDITITDSGSGGKNAQHAPGFGRVNATSYTAVSGQTIIVAKTGTYDVYWCGYRSSTGGTSGSCLYIGNTEHSSGVQTSFDGTLTNCQAVHLSNVSLTQGQTITVRARSRSNSYYMYIFGLTIIES